MDEYRVARRVFNAEVSGRRVRAVGMYLDTLVAAGYI